MRTEITRMGGRDFLGDCNLTGGFKYSFDYTGQSNFGGLRFQGIHKSCDW